MRREEEEWGEREEANVLVKDQGISPRKGTKCKEKE